MQQRGIAAAPNTAHALLDAAYEELGKANKPELDAAWGRLEHDPWPLPNVWCGVSVEDRKHGMPRIDELRRVPATVRMLSCEPLLEDLGALDLAGVGWVIAGCESGPGARPCEVEWLRSICDQCATAGVPFFAKQAKPREGAYSITDIRPLPEIEGRIGELIPVVAHGPGSKRKPGGVIGAPYLDGVQHLAFPVIR